MNTFSSDSLVSKCFYRGAGVFCQDGHLYRMTPEKTDGTYAELERLDGIPLQCPACEGKGVLLTDKGREVLAFIETFGRPFLRDLIDEIFEERTQR